MTVFDRGRLAAERLMCDTLAAYSPGNSTPDADGMIAETWVDQGTTSGKLRVASSRGDTVSRKDVAEVDRPVVRGELHIPMSAQEPVIGWRYTCTATGPSTDSALVGRSYLVTGVPTGSYLTARRLDVVEVP